MVDVEGKPFLEYELELLRSHGIRDIVLCIGHKADVIELLRRRRALKRRPQTHPIVRFELPDNSCNGPK